METGSLIPKFLQEVRDYCVENLAELIYNYVEHSEPRKEADWNSSERWFEKNPGCTMSLTEKFLLFSGYEEVRKERPHMDEIGRREHHIEKMGLFYEIENREVEIIKDRLVFLTDKEFLQIIERIDDNKKIKYKKEFLIGDIWEIYQKMVRCNYFFFNGYGKITFF